MKYALLIYSPITADEYAANLDQARKTSDGYGPWVDYTRAARAAGVFVAAEQLVHTETATSLHADAAGSGCSPTARSWRPRSTCSAST